MRIILTRRAMDGVYFARTSKESRTARWRAYLDRDRRIQARQQEALHFAVVAQHDVRTRRQPGDFVTAVFVRIRSAHGDVIIGGNATSDMVITGVSSINGVSS